MPGTTAPFDHAAQRGVSRRSLMKGVAWAAPVIAAAVAAPIAAASTPAVLVCSGTLCFGGVTIGKYCPSNGQPNEYWACVSFTNKSTVPVTVTYDFSVTTSSNGTVHFAGSVLVPANSSRCTLVAVTKNVNNASFQNCSNGTYSSFSLDFTDGTNHGTATVPAGSTGGNAAPVCSC